MKRKSILTILALSIIAACSSDPKSNPDIPGGSAGRDGEAKINCVANNGLLVSKKGGGWWCKVNGQLNPLTNYY